MLVYSVHQETFWRDSVKISPEKITPENITLEKITTRKKSPRERKKNTHSR